MAMTATEFKTKIRRLTHTNSNDYTDANLIADLNEELSLVQIKLLRDRGVLGFDDVNYTDLPVATFSITAGTREYKITGDENANEILSIHKVGVLQNGQYQDVPRIKVTEGNQTALLDNSTATTPSGYYEIGANIVFAEAPSGSTTGKIWFDRSIDFLVSGDTTKVAGVPEHYHDLAAYRTALKYEDLPDNLFSKYTRIIQDRELHLEDFEEARRDDESTTVTVQTFSGI